MAKVTIAKLLKVKNRLKSEAARIKSKIHASNSYEEGAKFTDVGELMARQVLVIRNLVEVKSAIARANNKVQDKIFNLSEIKGLIASYEALACTEGNVRPLYGREEATKWVSQLPSSERDKLVKELILKSEALQDELDEHNATHRVEIADEFLTTG